MRDITFKSTTLRTAVATAELKVSLATVDILRRGEVPKGDPLLVAKVAAVMAAKKTTEWIPYCHNIPIEHVDVAFEVTDNLIVVMVKVSSVAKTGVEMEALTAASAAVLTLYDMLKMLDEEMEIGTIRLLEKTVGKSDISTVLGWSGAVLTVSDM
jgi:cyclic pyranopterin phosphate synthase